jgi:hypothetical protein
MLAVFKSTVIILITLFAIWSYDYILNKIYINLINLMSAVFVRNEIFLFAMKSFSSEIRFVQKSDKHLSDNTK